MPKGPLGAPRPFAHQSLTVEVKLGDIGHISEQPMTKVARARSTIESRVIESVGSAEFDAPKDTVLVEIKGGRITPKEAESIGEIVTMTFDAEGYDVVITV